MARAGFFPGSTAASVLSGFVGNSMGPNQQFPSSFSGYGPSRQFFNAYGNVMGGQPPGYYGSQQPQYQQQPQQGQWQQLQLQQQQQQQQMQAYQQQQLQPYQPYQQTFQQT